MKNSEINLSWIITDNNRINNSWILLRAGQCGDFADFMGPSWGLLCEVTGANIKLAVEGQYNISKMLSGILKIALFQIIISI